MSFVLMSGVSNDAEAELLSAWMTCVGVPFGAKSANQVVAVNPERPCSCAVGISGNAAERVGTNVGTAFSVPDFTGGIPIVITGQKKAICPAIKSFIAGPPPW